MPEVAEAPKPVETATTTPPSTETPVTTPAESKESTKVGMFDHLAIDKPKSETKPEVKSETKGTETKTSEPPKTEKLLAGRFKTPEELEKAYQESSSEGLRLWQEQKAYAAKVQERDAKIAELEDQIKLISNQEPFKELSKEELKDLSEKDPAAAIEYVAEKKLRDRDLATAKQRLKDERENQARTIGETRQFILGRGEHMAANPDKFPHFEDLLPNMEKMKDIMGEAVKDKKWAPDIIYLASLGQLHLQTLQKGKVSTDEAAKKAAAEANAIASTTGPSGKAPAETPSGKEDLNSDKAVKERILKAAPSRLFSF